MPTFKATKSIRVEMDDDGYLAFVYGLLVIMVEDKEKYFFPKGDCRVIAMIRDIRAISEAAGIHIKDADNGRVYVSGLKDAKVAFEQCKSVMGF